jgi:hypothetical protein
LFLAALKGQLDKRGAVTSSARTLLKILPMLGCLMTAASTCGASRKPFSSGNKQRSYTLALTLIAQLLA